MTEDKLIRDYVENIRDVITSEEYIERGARYNYYNVMMLGSKEFLETL